MRQAVDPLPNLRLDEISGASFHSERALNMTAQAARLGREPVRTFQRDHSIWAPPSQDVFGTSVHCLFLQAGLEQRS